MKGIEIRSLGKNVDPKQLSNFCEVTLLNCEQTPTIFFGLFALYV